MNLQPYRTFRPTAFDSAGAFLTEQGDWLVAPCSITRDSGHLDQSNWDQQLAALTEADPDANDHEIHRFGHWGPGWFEIVLVRPRSKAESVVRDLGERLDDYPVLDEEDFSRREWEAYLAVWESGEGAKELAREMRKAGWSDCVTETVADGDADTVRVWFESLIPSGDYYCEDYPQIRRAVENLERLKSARDRVAELVRKIRRETGK